jgi:hypothetical protein
MLKSRILKPTLAAVTIASAIGLTSLGTVAASAAPATTATTANGATHSRSLRPLYAIVCGGDACIQTASISGPLAKVNAWANRTTFYGYFQLVDNCDITVATSPTETWPAGGHHYTFTNIHYADCGNYWYVTAWRKNSSGKPTNLGTAEFSI